MDLGEGLEAKEERKGKREKSKRRGVLKNPIDSRAYGVYNLREDEIKTAEGARITND